MPGEVTRKNSDSGRKRASYINDNEGSGSSGGVAPTIVTNNSGQVTINIDQLIIIMWLLHFYSNTVYSVHVHVCY